MWGGTPKSGKEDWFLIGTDKYSLEEIPPELRLGSNTTSRKGGTRILDKTDIPTTNKKDMRIEVAIKDLTRMIPNQPNILKPDVLRPRDNPFLHLLPDGNRPLTLRELAPATNEFLRREGIEKIKTGPIANSVPNLVIRKSINTFGIVGIGVSLYLYSVDNTTLAAIIGFGSLLMLMK